MTLREALQDAEEVVFTDGVCQWRGDEVLQVLEERVPYALDRECHIDADGIVFEREDGEFGMLRPA